MVIVETEAEYELFVEAMKETGVIVIPVFCDINAHPCANTLCFLYVQGGGGKSFVLPFNHDDALNLAIDRFTEPINKKVYTPDKKKLLHLPIVVGEEIVDVNGLDLLYTGQVTEESFFYTVQMRQMYNQFRTLRNLNRAVPLMQLVGYCEAYAKGMELLIENETTKLGFPFHNDVVIPTCAFMERSGVHIDPEIFGKFHELPRKPADNLLYTEYNPYTSTRRVTNKFAGTNFSALNKTNGEREAFTSRFPNGKMVLIDFESFHLRLMADEMDYQLPSEPVHTFLAKQYFQTDSPTPEQYDAGKKLTFRFTYSTQREGADIPFFDRVYEFIDYMWVTMQETGRFVTKEGYEVRLDRMEDPNPSKAFNYFLQLKEMEVAMASISLLRPLYSQCASKVVLYTFDSLLIDYSPIDGKSLLTETVRILENGGKYPVRVYAGKTYNALDNITHIIKT